MARSVAAPPTGAPTPIEAEPPIDRRENTDAPAPEEPTADGLDDQAANIDRSPDEPSAASSTEQSSPDRSDADQTHASPEVGLRPPVRGETPVVHREAASTTEATPAPVSDPSNPPSPPARHRVTRSSLEDRPLGIRPPEPRPPSAPAAVDRAEATDTRDHTDGPAEFLAPVDDVTAHDEPDPVPVERTSPDTAPPAPPPVVDRSPRVTPTPRPTAPSVAPTTAGIVADRQAAPPPPAEPAPPTDSGDGIEFTPPARPMTALPDLPVARRESPSRPPVRTPGPARTMRPRQTPASAPFTAETPGPVFEGGPASSPPPPDGLDLLLQRATERSPDHTDTRVPSMAGMADEGGGIDRDVDSAPPPPAGSSSDDDNPAELADQIYERIERRLRGELFRDLERRGHLSEWG